MVLAALETLFLPPGLVSRDLCRLTRGGICSMQKFHWSLNKRPIVPWEERGRSWGDLSLRDPCLAMRNAPYEKKMTTFRSLGDPQTPKGPIPGSEMGWSFACVCVCLLWYLLPNPSTQVRPLDAGRSVLQGAMCILPTYTPLPELQVSSGCLLSLGAPYSVPHSTPSNLS